MDLWVENPRRFIEIQSFILGSFENLLVKAKCLFSCSHLYSALHIRREKDLKVMNFFCNVKIKIPIYP